METQRIQLAQMKRSGRNHFLQEAERSGERRSVEQRRAVVTIMDMHRPAARLAIGPELQHRSVKIISRNAGVRAGAGYEEARRGRLGTASAPDLAGNATRRCEAQPAADRAACAQRILGAGTAEGSVEGGGLLRQTETTTK